jgi:hypothetical protein
MNTIVQGPDGSSYAILETMTHQYFQYMYQYKSMAIYQQLTIKPGNGDIWSTSSDNLILSTELPPV